MPYDEQPEKRHLSEDGTRIVFTRRYAVAWNGWGEPTKWRTKVRTVRLRQNEIEYYRQCAAAERAEG